MRPLPRVPLSLSLPGTAGAALKPIDADLRPIGNKAGRSENQLQPPPGFALALPDPTCSGFARLSEGAHGPDPTRLTAVLEQAVP